MKYNLYLNELVRKAGDIATKNFRKVSFKEKSVGNLLTAVDLEVENYLIKNLLETFPNDSIISEESELIKGSSNRTWVVDPIDGTADYANGLNTWAISIALIENEEVLLGVVYAPLLNKYYYAGKGIGSYCNQEPNLIKNAEFSPSFFYATNASSHLTLSLKLQMRVCNFPTALAPCVVSEGIALGSVTVPAYLWDIAAAYIIAKEAGLDFRYLSGKPFEIKELQPRNKMKEALFCGNIKFIDYASLNIKQRVDC
jgi:myo-inositol-1(or 4)-monophosphatase